MSNVIVRALLAHTLLLAVRAEASPQCLYAETPPDPPDKGAVLWSPPAPGSTAPNTVVIGLNDSWDVEAKDYRANATVQQPRVISVAKGAALLLLLSRRVYSGLRVTLGGGQRWPDFPGRYLLTKERPTGPRDYPIRLR